MIIATNPLKWRKANWTDLRAYVAECAAVTLHPENYPARYWPKKVSTKDALEDLRRLVWLKEHPQAGQIDDSILEFALPELDPGEPIYKYRGEWIVTTYDIFLKRWFWWVNKEDKQEFLYLFFALSSPMFPSSIFFETIVSSTT